MDRRHRADARGLVARLTEVSASTRLPPRRSTPPAAEPTLSVHGSYLHVRVAADRTRSSPRLAVARRRRRAQRGHHFHERPISFLDDLDDRSRRTPRRAARLAVVPRDAAARHRDQLPPRGRPDRGRRRAARRPVARGRGSRRMLTTWWRSAAGSPPAPPPRAPPLRVRGARRRGPRGRRGRASPGNVALADVAKATRRRWPPSRAPATGARVVQRLRDADRAAHERHDEGADARHRVVAAGSLIAGLLGMNVTVPLDKDDPCRSGS